METPITGVHLQQFVCALQWIKNGIPDFSKLINPLHDFMELVYDKSGKRTSRAVAGIYLATAGWSKDEDTAFEECKRALAHQVTLSHRDETQRLCVCIDASDLCRSGIVTHVPREDLALLHVKQRHSPLVFSSGRFSKTQLGRSVLEKEAYAVMATLSRTHWPVATPAGFHLHSDNKNLIYLYIDPLSVVQDLSQTTLRKVFRWADRLSIYNYTCFHIKGPDKVWADHLTRWSSPGIIRRLVRIPELPSSSAEEFEWHSKDEIVASQAEAASTRPPNLSLLHGQWVNPQGATWIPDAGSELQLRLCMISHTGPSGHRGQATTEQVLRKCYLWSTVTTDIRSFVRACIHCLSTTGGGKVPRHFGPSAHGTSRNDLIQFDYLEIGPSHTGDKYILMLRDDHSDYKWLLKFADTTAENASHALIDWAAAFTVPSSLMSDGPTHFRNETLRLVSRGLKTLHHFTLPYMPCSNGAVERLGKEILCVIRVVTSELQLSLDEWLDLVPLVHRALNSVPSPHRRNVAPVTAFTGMEPTPPISTFIRSSDSSVITLSELRTEKCLNIKKHQQHVVELHPVVYDSLHANRERSRMVASKGKIPHFQEGGLVLVAHDDFFEGSMLALFWRDLSLRNGNLEDIHGCRLKSYSDRCLNKEAIISHVVSSERGISMDRLMKLVDSPDGLQIHVRWKGLPNSEDTLKPLAKIYKDVPRMLLRLLDRKNTPAHLATKARSILSIDGGV